LLLYLAIFWLKFGSDEDWVCQLLIEYVNNKSPRCQEVTDYALYWIEGPMVLFSLKSVKRDKNKLKETPSKWDSPSFLPPPYKTEA
jgi:hypothetical protein